MLSSARMQQTDGLIFSPLGMGEEDAGHLLVDYPLVILGERIFGGPTDHVTMKNVEAARAATAYLVSRGRRRIALIGAHAGEVVGSAGLRLRGHLQALEEAGIAPDPDLVAYAGLWHRANGAEGMRSLIERGVSFDAVFGLNDTLALGALRVLLTSGYAVPDDVAVIGFDNLDETQYSVPSLTTVDAGRTAIARQAVDLLVARMAERDGVRAEPHELLMDFSIVERESTP